jgi:hypothetical protein
MEEDQAPRFSSPPPPREPAAVVSKFVQSKLRFTRELGMLFVRALVRAGHQGQEEPGACNCRMIALRGASNSGLFPSWIQREQ